MRALYSVGYSIGDIKQSPIDEETVSSGEWVAQNGRDMSRTTYADLSTYYPINVTTSTARTLNAVPNASVIEADSTNFICPGVAGTSPLQYSTTGASWLTSATWGASTAVYCIKVCGSRIIITGSGGDLTVPYVCNVNVANPADKANYTATTGGPSSTLINALAHDSVNNKTLGITGSGATVYTLTTVSTTWSSVTVTSATRLGCTFTGQKLAILTDTGMLQISSDGGATFVDSYSLPFAIHTSQSAIASDASSGLVVIATVLGGALIFYVSTDHCATWQAFEPPLEALMSNNGTADFAVWSINGGFKYVNGKFILAERTAYRTLWSTTGKNWFVENPQMRGVRVQATATAYKSSTYCMIGNNNVANCLTFTEDTTKFRLTRSVIRSASNSTYPASAQEFQRYIKAL